MLHERAYGAARPHFRHPHLPSARRRRDRRTVRRTSGETDTRYRSLYSTGQSRRRWTMSTTRVGLSDALPGDSRIVIGPDGTVLAATGDQLSKLVDMRLEECEALPREIREAGTALAGRLRDSGSRVTGPDHRPERRRICSTGRYRGGCRSARSHRSTGAPVIKAVRHLLPGGLRRRHAQCGGCRRGSGRGASRFRESRMGGDHPGRKCAAVFASGIPPEAWSHRSNDDVRARKLRGRHRSERQRPGDSCDTVTRLFKRDGLDVRGAGLALPLLADIMAAHGGRVAVSSSTDPVGHGTTIRLTFPAR